MAEQLEVEALRELSRRRLRPEEPHVVLQPLLGDALDPLDLLVAESRDPNTAGITAGSSSVPVKYAASSGASGPVHRSYGNTQL